MSSPSRRRRSSASLRGLRRSTNLSRQAEDKTHWWQNDAQAGEEAVRGQAAPLSAVGAGCGTALPQSPLSVALKAGAYELSPTAYAVSASITGAMSAARPNLALAIVVDVSSSMRGSPLDLVKSTLQKFLQRGELRPDDLLSIITFSAQATLLLPMQPFSQQESNVRDIVSGMQAAYGTDIGSGLRLAFDTMRSIASDKASHARMHRIMLFSDGRPYLGLRTQEDLISAISSWKKHLPDGCGLSIDTFGYSNHVDDRLLAAIASQNDGIWRYITSTEDIDKQLLDQWGIVKSGLLWDLQVVFTAETNAALGYMPGNTVPTSEPCSESEVRAGLGGIAQGQTRHALCVAQQIKSTQDGRVTVYVVSSTDKTIATAQVVLPARQTADDAIEVDADVDVQMSRATTATALELGVQLGSQGKFAEARDSMNQARSLVQRRHERHTPMPGCNGACSVFLDDLGEGEQLLSEHASKFHPAGAAPMSNMAEAHRLETSTGFGAKEGEMYRTETQQAALALKARMRGLANAGRTMTPGRNAKMNNVNGELSAKLRGRGRGRGGRGGRGRGAGPV